MTVSRAPYMEWARHRPSPEVDLAGSNLLPCTLDDLPCAREALEIAGESPDGYPPLVEAIAGRYGVAADRVATAGGCSGANFLACAALLETGDEVRVFNDRGETAVRCRVSRRIMPGVVTLPEGSWWNPSADGVDHGGSANVLTSERWTPLAFGSAQHTVMVEVRKG